MENNEELENQEVDIKAVNPGNAQYPNGGVLVNDDGYERWASISPPANVRFAKKGRAIIRVNEDGDVIYLRMTSSGGSSYSGPSRPSYPKRNGFNTASQYNPVSTPKPKPKTMNDVVVFSGITLEEFSQKYGQIQKVGKILASKSDLIPVEQLKKGEVEKATGENGKRLYDCQIFYEFEVPKTEEEFPDY